MRDDPVTACDCQTDRGAHVSHEELELLRERPV